MQAEFIVHYPQNTLGVIMEEEKSMELEYAVAEYLFDERRKELGVSLDGLAKKAFPDLDVSTTRMKVHRFLKKKPEDTPKRLTLGDFFRYCELLGVAPDRAITLILARKGMIPELKI